MKLGPLGSFLNDVLSPMGMGHEYCDDSLSTKKRDDWGERGIQNCPKLRDVIYGRPVRYSIAISGLKAT